ncbi:MAG: CAP domain-containing protein [Candidatus Syntrophopropionicum ammoniitolerans]
MFELVNQERVKAGLEALQWDNNLVKLARLKAQDLIAKGYFSHTSPTYGFPFEMMKAYEVQYSRVGENLVGAVLYKEPMSV